VNHPTPTRADHEKFCRIEGWTSVRNARGSKTNHHVTYELALPDGNVLRTRVSHPIDRSDYGPALWSHVLRDQLKITEDEFWDCVNNGVRPPRGTPQVPSHSLPADLVHQLVVKFRVPEVEVASMDKEQAVSLLQSLWMSEIDHHEEAQPATGRDSQGSVRRGSPPEWRS
jgi:hypothetical protein